MLFWPAPGPPFEAGWVARATMWLREFFAKSGPRRKSVHLNSAEERVSIAGMKALPTILLLLGLPVTVTGQSTPVADPSQARVLVQNFYRQVVAHETIGIYGAEWKLFAPYFSVSLSQEIKTAQSCGRDWSRQAKKRPPEKSPFSMEEGVLSGTDDTTGDRPSFSVERTVTGKDGSIRVYVIFKQLWPSPEKPVIWEVAPRLLMEGGHLVIDDIIYLQGDDSSLSEFLKVPGCEGSRWVGYAKK